MVSRPSRRAATTLWPPVSSIEYALQGEFRAAGRGPPSLRFPGSRMRPPRNGSRWRDCMDARARRKLDVGARALEFGHAHPLESPGYAATMVKLEERLVRADMLATQQRDGILAVRAATGYKRDLIGKMRRAHLTHLARIAEVAGGELPESPQKFLLKPGKGSSGRSGPPPGACRSRRMADGRSW